MLTLAFAQGAPAAAPSAGSSSLVGLMPIAIIFIIFFWNDIMADLTLDEYQGFSEEELGRILQAEAKNMFNSKCHENDFRENSSCLHTPLEYKHKATQFISQYWARFTDFIFSNIPKILSNLARGSS